MATCPRPHHKSPYADNRPHLSRKRFKRYTQQYLIDTIMAFQGRIGFIGAGQMAEALARGFHNKGVAQPEQMCCTDPVSARRDLFNTFGVTAYETAREVGAMHAVVPSCTCHNPRWHKTPRCCLCQSSHNTWLPFCKTSSPA